MKILYLYPEEFWGKPSLMTIFNRISNYLNFKKKELKTKIEEHYIDLRLEDLPEFTPENIKVYRKKLIQILDGLYTSFKFDLVAISCYSSFNYLNSVEVAFLIKKFIDSNIIIVVGGVHASMCPDNFQPGNLPEYLYKSYSKKYSPFDFLIKEEGEFSFFQLIKDLENGYYKREEKESKNCIVLKPLLVEDLNEIPLLNLDLFKKYKSKLQSIDSIWLDF
ncbi:MAG: hypothetical protein GF353_18800, partial [Candidatus Lokiarchaeota archaeon]|nr:hypothetical protein [Candidatus Lokiarchaeota archaeon]